MLTIRPWMVSWVRLMHACGAVTTCVWSAYGLCPSHFDCLCREGIQLTRMNGIRARALFFDPEDESLNTPLGGPMGGGRVRLFVHTHAKTTYCLPTDGDLVTQHNSGLCMLVARALLWSIQGGRTSGGPTMGGENNQTPKIL